MAEPDLSLITPIVPSPESWLAAVLDNFETFLQDHASCEKKASGMAMSMASHYPDKPELLSAMADLAVEELTHYREVIRLMQQRGIIPAADTKDPYINLLNRQVRKGADVFLMDRLLIGAIVERRGAERFACIAQAVTDPQLTKFYQAIAASEARHWTLFYNLAWNHCDQPSVAERFVQLSELEADMMLSLPARAALH
jgi:tRNA-(ms[2]io[6]A)-hydroxylase